MDDTTALRWSGTYAVLPTSFPACMNLSGDKIILPQSALEQILAASSAQRVALSPNRNEAYSGFGLPQSYENGDSSQLGPSPLIFRLVNPTNNNVVYAGIREFSAPEGTIGLSPFLADALAIKQGDSVVSSDGGVNNPVDFTESQLPSAPAQIAIKTVQLSKGTYVRLRPLEAGYDPDDWKHLLERQLRNNFTSLTKNAVLSVQGVHGEEFRLLVDEFAPVGDGICVVDTDLEVDIEALNEEQARETMRQMISKEKSTSDSGSSKGGELDIWKDIEGHVAPGRYVDYTLPSWDRSQSLTITLSGISEEAELDLFVTPKSRQQRSLPRDSLHVFGDFSPVTNGRKSITVSPTNVELEGAESILISVHGYQGPATAGQSVSSFTYNIRAQATAARGTADESIELDDPEHSADEEQCRNCHQWVPKRTIVLHENFCRRNNILCTLCQSVFKKDSVEWESHWHCDHDNAYGSSTSSKAKHDQVFHTDRSCPSCEFSTNSLSDLARHRASVCPGKIILCRFCHLEVPQEGDPFNPAPEVVLSGMTAHELADGARTTECHLCNKIIRLRDMETHLKHHELDKVNRSKPLICQNVNCGRTLYGVGPRGQIKTGATQDEGTGNSIGLCSMCFGPLYVSMHDPEGKALRRRIERKYLGQMMTGCGKSHCANEWCKTGRANANLDPKGSSAQAVLPMVKPLLIEALSDQEPKYFCADEATQTRRKLAEMVAAERAWDIEWCVAAAEAEKGNLDKMRDWLHAWAPNV